MKLVIAREKVKGPYHQSDAANLALIGGVYESVAIAEGLDFVAHLLGRFGRFFHFLLQSLDFLIVLLDRKQENDQTCLKPRQETHSL